jgi:hypothetical protein
MRTVFAWKNDQRFADSTFSLIASVCALLPSVSENERNSDQERDPPVRVRRLFDMLGLFQLLVCFRHLSSPRSPFRARRGAAPQDDG